MSLYTVKHQVNSTNIILTKDNSWHTGARRAGVQEARDARRAEDEPRAGAGEAEREKSCETSQDFIFTKNLKLDTL
jgi:hypothetical protein